MVKRALLATLTLSVLVPLGGSAGAAVHAPIIVRHHGRTATQSTNWSGYAIYKSGVTFTDVKGSWVQPTATCNTTGHKYSSFWVGIDGYNSGSVEQLGTDTDCTSQNHPQYYAWYEMYPAGSVQINTVTVHPGDSFTAEVSRAGSTYTLKITDNTTGQSFSINKTQSGLSNSSAEWVAEAPSSCGVGGCHVLPLANFGTVNFSNASATNSSGHTGPINDTAWSRDQITMVTSGGVTKAKPSSLGTGGASFSVTWKHS